MLPLLLLACGQPDDTIGPFTWTDTAIAKTWESPLVFDGPPPKHLLMVSVDTLRKDALGHYGGPPTPFFDRLMAEGVTLDDHMQCSSWTFASTTCTLAGRYPEDLRYMPRLTQNQDPLPEGTMLLAGWLAEAGFTTLLESPNAWLSENWGNAQGYQIVPATESMALGNGRAAYEHLMAESPERWMLHLHVAEPHAPYSPPDSYLGALEELPPVDYDLSDRDEHYSVNGNDKYDRLPPEEQALVKAHLQARYAAEVAWLDDSLNTWFGELEAAGALDDTLVVLWTDHGEAFWEHGYQTHAWTLGPETNDGVAVFWAKNLQPGAWSGPTSAVDLVPTLLDVWDLPVPEEVTGVPLGSALSNRARFATIDARAGVIQAVRKEEFVLHFFWKGGRLELYDRVADPGSTTNLYRSDHPAVPELWSILSKRVEALEPLVPSSPGIPKL